MYGNFLTCLSPLMMLKHGVNLQLYNSRVCLFLVPFKGKANLMSLTDEGYPSLPDHRPAVCSLSGSHMLLILRKAPSSAWWWFLLLSTLPRCFSSVLFGKNRWYLLLLSKTVEVLPSMINRLCPFFSCSSRGLWDSQEGLHITLACSPHLSIWHSAFSWWQDFQRQAVLWPFRLYFVLHRDIPALWLTEAVLVMLSAYPWGSWASMLDNWC